MDTAGIYYRSEDVFPIELNTINAELSNLLARSSALSPLPRLLIGAAVIAQIIVLSMVSLIMGIAVLTMAALILEIIILVTVATALERGFIRLEDVIVALEAAASVTVAILMIVMATVGGNGNLNKNAEIASSLAASSNIVPFKHF